MLDVISLILRTVAYLWVGTEAFFLAHLYSYGYVKYKNTPIICALQRLFMFIGLMFIVLAFLPIIHNLNDSLYNLVVKGGLLAIFVIPVGFYLTKFRSESLSAVKPKKEQK